MSPYLLIIITGKLHSQTSITAISNVATIQPMRQDIQYNLDLQYKTQLEIRINDL